MSRIRVVIGMLAAMLQQSGFIDPVHEAQHTFRALMDALAQPGKPQILKTHLTSWEKLSPACAASCLTLMDLDTRVWLDPTVEDLVKQWLVFHSGCQITVAVEEALFAVITNIEELPPLKQCFWGTAEDPERSATLLVQLPALTGGPIVELQGPGIPEKRAIAPRLPADFWPQWDENYAAYPRGVDVFFYCDRTIMGLPRTTKASMVSP